jgi:hypothetical protein
MNALKSIRNGDSRSHLFSPEGKTGLAEDVTAQFDLTHLDEVKQRTRGPARKGAQYDESLYGLTEDNKAAIARELLHNPALADKASGKTPPISSPRQEDDKGESK